MAARLDCVQMDADRRARLEAADWAEIGIRLTAYATWKARNFRWRTRQEWALAAGKTPEDIAREAIVKVLDGTRAWRPARGLLLPFLQGIVDSLMSHLAASGDNALLEPLHEALPERIASSEPERAAGAELVDRLRAALAQQGASELLAILDAVEAYGPKPSAIAIALGTTVNDIHNRLKRLRRTALRVLHTASASQGA